MSRKWIYPIALLLLSILWICIPHTSVSAHSMVILDTPTPTPTPDANAILNQANAASNQAQNLNTVVTLGLVIVGLIFTAIALVSGVFAYAGFSSLKDVNETREQVRKDLEGMRKNLEDMRKNAADVQGTLLYLGLGDRLRIQGLTAEATESYRKAGTFLPKDEQVNYVLGRIYSSAGYLDDAIRALGKATEGNPANSEAWKELGLVYRRRGAQMQDPENYDKAVECLKKAITLKPDYDAYAIIGGLYRRQEQYQRALANYKQAYSINPRSSYALGNIASLSWYLGEVQEARMHFEEIEKAAHARIAARSPESYWDYYDLALSQLVLGKTDDAIKSYKQAIANTPPPGIVVFESVLDNLKLLQKASTSQQNLSPLPDLPQAIGLIEKAKSQSH